MSNAQAKLAQKELKSTEDPFSKLTRKTVEVTNTDHIYCSRTSLMFHYTTVRNSSPSNPRFFSGNSNQTCLHHWGCGRYISSLYFPSSLFLTSLHSSPPVPATHQSHIPIPIYWCESRFGSRVPRHGSIYSWPLRHHARIQALDNSPIRWIQVGISSIISE